MRPNKFILQLRMHRAGAGGGVELLEENLRKIYGSKDDILYRLCLAIPGECDRAPAILAGSRHQEVVVTVRPAQSPIQNRSF